MIIQSSPYAVIEKTPDLEIDCDLCGERWGVLLLTLGKVDQSAFSVCIWCALSLIEALKQVTS